MVAHIFTDPTKVPFWDVCLVFPGKDDDANDVSTRVYAHKIKLNCMKFFEGLFETDPHATEYKMTSNVINAGLSVDVFVSVLPHLYDEFEVPNVNYLKGRGAPGWLMDVDRMIDMAAVDDAIASARLRHICVLCQDKDAMVGHDVCRACHMFKRYDPNDPEEPKHMMFYTGRTFASPDAVARLMAGIDACPVVTCEALDRLLSNTIQSTTFLDDDQAADVLAALAVKKLATKCIDLYKHVYMCMMRPWTYRGPHERVFQCYYWSTIEGRGLAPKPLTYHIINVNGREMLKAWRTPGHDRRACRECAMMEAPGV